MTTPKIPSEIKEKLAKIVEIISEKQAKDIVIIDVRNLSGLCDYFIICSADSARQVKAIYQDVVKQCRKSKLKAQHFEGDESLRWVLVDFFDIVFHVFSAEARGFYNLENLWSAAKKVSLSSLPLKNLP